MEKKRLPDEIALQLGDELGRMDAALSVFKDEGLTRRYHEWDMKNFLILEPKVEHLPAEFDRGRFADVFARFRSVKPIFDSLPMGIIHNDAGLHNLIVKDGSLASIIDFSDIAFSPYIQNVAVALAQGFFAYNWDPRQAALFLEAYRSHNALSQLELGVLFEITLARHASYVIECNHLNLALGPDPQRTEAVHDYYGFMLKLDDFGQTGVTDDT